MLKEGQKLWFVSNQHPRIQGREVTVTKVGRKWAQLSNRMRIEIDSLIADGGQYSSPGKCYNSQEDYEAELAIKSAWHRFRKSIDRQFSMPSDMTLERINAARRVLGILDHQ